MSDLQQMGGSVAQPELTGDDAVLTGSAPVSELRDYGLEVTAYTRGRGRLLCSLRGYEPCRDQAAVVEAMGYEPLRDVENPVDSVFCAHGGGYTVPWDEVPACAHIPPCQQPVGDEPAERTAPVPPPRTAAAGGFEQNQELRAIFERTYGPVKRRDFRSQQEVRQQEGVSPEKRTIQPQKTGPEYLLVDGYNVIFAWDELKAVAQDNLDAARKMLCDLLSNYQGFRKNRVILVFDAYKVPHSTGEVTKYHNIHVVYTKESQTADAYIEKATYVLGRENRVRVVTSDGAEQLIILGHGALRVPASAFREEWESVKGQIAAIVSKNNQSAGQNRAVRAAWTKAQEKQ
jgi:predicted RNA-binding protein with PIN domain